MPSFYITTPIYYVNDLPHIGHIYTTVVADTVARYRRLVGDDAYFLTGTDEHGQNILRAAARQGVEPRQLADRVVSRYDELWSLLGISNDDFIRTTESRHHAGVKAIIERIAANDDFYVGSHEGWYCAACETFYTEKEMGPESSCPVHESPMEWRQEENVFFRLSRYQQPLLDWYEKHPDFVRPQSRANEVRSFVEGGLRDLSVSRADLPWGIPFPGHSQQTVYVWLDALTNYISALGFGDESPREDLYGRYWGDAGGTRMHLIGKDILRFHAVYWPAFLLSAGLPMPTTVWAHGWWLRDNRKISKSVGNMVRPDELLADFGADALRYFLLRDMVFGQDASFSDEAFIDRFNTDLANDLGNTVSRVVTLCRRTFDGRTPPVDCTDNPLIAASERAIAGYRKAMEQLAFHRALESLWGLLAETNQYLVQREPWKLVKTEGPSDRLSRILWNGVEATRIVSTALLPFMPQTAPRLLRALGRPASGSSAEEPFDLSVGAAALSWGGTPTGVELPEPSPLFPRIDKVAYLETPASEPGTEAPASAAKTTATDSAGDSDQLPSEAEKGTGMISIEQFFETDLRVATVTAAEAIPKSSKLLKVTVDVGGESRTVVAGIAKEYAPEDLIGRQVVVVANLQPAKLMGVESQGMILAASVDGRPILVQPSAAVPSGTQVR